MICNKCNENKELSEFYFRKETNSYRKVCKICRRNQDNLYRDSNPEIIKERNKRNYIKNRKIPEEVNKQRIRTKAQYNNNKEYYKKHRREWYLKNKEKYNEGRKDYYQNNKSIFRHKDAKRRAIELQARPEWVNNKDMKEIYKSCPKGFEVDHIIPLNHKLVCGLDVPWNLQYLEKSKNRSKGNKLEVSLG